MTRRQTARSLALEATTRARRDGSWITQTISAALDRSSLDHRDRAFAARLSRGVVEHSGTLDELIDAVADRPSRIEPRVRDALRLAAYEAVFLDTPKRAVVSEGVDLVRSITPRASGYANAVLRRLVEHVGDFPFGDPSTDLAALARLTGHPQWLAERIAADIGVDAARRMMIADAEPAPFTCAVNQFRCTGDEALAALVHDGAGPSAGRLEGSIVCADPAAAVRGAAVADGCVIVCDEAAQAVCASLPLAQGITVVDVAAGRGTKTALIKGRARAEGIEVGLTAIDVHAFKTKLLEQRMELLGIPGVVVETCDATDAAALTRLGLSADLVMVDAPCSGLGTLRRHPEKRWSITPDGIGDVAHLGAGILAASAHLVRLGGFVVYSTCTVTREENAEVVRSFVEASGGRFVLESLRGRVPDAFERWVTADGHMQTLPEPGGPDGHFAALIKRVR